MRNRIRVSCAVLTASLLCALAPAPCRAQMIDPAIDVPGQPFSYFRFPTDTIGHMDAREATEITPEGYLYTGYGELIFFYGNPPVPVNQRVRTLHEGRLPILRYSFDQDGVRHTVTTFAFTLDGTPETDLVNFVRVELENLGRKPRAASWTVGARYAGESNSASGIPDHRFLRPIARTRLGKAEHEGVLFSPEWVFVFKDGMLLRDGKAFYFYPEALPHETFITLRDRYTAPAAVPALPTTPVGLVRYNLVLKPGERRTIDLKMPFRPLAETDAAFGAVVSARFDDYFERTVRFWHQLFARGTRITVPEPKVNDTFDASLVYELIARNKLGPHYVQRGAPLHYHSFWLRDATDHVRAYDVTGYPDLAAQVAKFFLEWQTDEGLFQSTSRQLDGAGQALWAFGQHYAMTNDREFARSVFPAIDRQMRWFDQATAGDPLHLLPAVRLADNENVTGHITGYSFWTLAGMRRAIALADALSEKEAATRYRRQEAEFLQHFKNALGAAAERTGGWIPPALAETGGRDWGNLQMLYPEQVLDPFDPLVTRTLEHARAKYAEGLLTYADLESLHHYATMFVTENQVVRGDQEQVLADFYALLLHTSSTHAGFEWNIRPWGDRDFGNNLSPHATFAAKYRSLLRNMLVREEGCDLHLFSVLSPEWTKPGQRITVANAPTEMGPLDMTFEFRPSGGVLTLNPAFRTPPAQIVVHVPWFVRLERATADGRVLATQGSAVRLPAQTKSVEFVWRRIGSATMSYETAVRNYLAEYRRRYAAFVRDGAGR